MTASYNKVSSAAVLLTTGPCCKPSWLHRYSVGSHLTGLQPSKLLCQFLQLGLVLLPLLLTPFPIPASQKIERFINARGLSGISCCRKSIALIWPQSALICCVSKYAVPAGLALPYRCCACRWRSRFDGASLDGSAVCNCIRKPPRLETINGCSRCRQASAHNGRNHTGTT